MTLISFQLIGIENYAIWSCAMKISLLGKNKLGFIDRSCTWEIIEEPLRNLCNRVNTILAWIMNFVSKELLSGIVYSMNTYQVWQDLQERFDKPH